MLIAPDGYLSGVRKLCTQHNVLLIVDEVATGFGRTGTMFACEQEGVEPDLMCVAKGLTGGYLPLAATLATEEIYAEFLGKPADNRTFYHGHSYTGNALACAAALASMKIFEADNVLGHVSEIAETAAGSLQSFTTLTHVAEIRRKGLMVGIELMGNVSAQEAYAPGLTVGAKVCRVARDLGLITRPLGDTIVFMPPLVSTHAEVCEMLEIIKELIRRVTER